MYLRTKMKMRQPPPPIDDNPSRCGPPRLALQLLSPLHNNNSKMFQYICDSFSLKKQQINHIQIKKRHFDCKQRKKRKEKRCRDVYKWERLRDAARNVAVTKNSSGHAIYGRTFVNNQSIIILVHYIKSMYITSVQMKRL